MTKTSRNYLIAFLITLALIGVASYLQYFEGILPCPLCSIQRLILYTISFLFFLGIFASNRAIGRISIGVVSALCSFIGIIFSGRQVWLQYYPPHNVGNCELSLRYMLDVLPLNEVIKRVFIGGTDCSRVDWQFLHLSLAQWSLICFIFFFFFAMRQLKK